MGSVQDFGEMCPVCGKNAFASDYYYKTGEDYSTCLYCGYSHKLHIKRDGEGTAIFEPKCSLSLPCDDLVLVECSLDSPRQVDSDFSVIRPVPADMTTKELYSYLNSPPSGILRFVCLRQQDGTFQQVSYRLTDMTIENMRFQALDVCWLEEESGGYGMLRVTKDGGISAWYSLDKDTSIEDMLKELPEHEGLSAVGVKFSEPGKNPTFYGITEAEWLKLTVDEETEAVQ